MPKGRKSFAVVDLTTGEIRSEHTLWNTAADWRDHRAAQTGNRHIVRCIIGK